MTAPSIPPATNPINKYIISIFQNYEKSGEVKPARTYLEYLFSKPSGKLNHLRLVSFTKDYLYLCEISEEYECFTGRG